MITEASTGRATEAIPSHQTAGTGAVGEARFNNLKVEGFTFLFISTLKDCDGYIDRVTSQKKNNREKNQCFFPFYSIFVWVCSGTHRYIYIHILGSLQGVEEGNGAQAADS